MKFDTRIGSAIKYYGVPHATDKYMRSFAMPEGTKTIIMSDGSSFVFFGDNSIQRASSIRSKMDMFECNCLTTDEYILAMAKKEPTFEISLEPTGEKYPASVPELLKKPEAIGYCSYSDLEKLVKTLKIAGAAGIIKISVGNSEEHRSLVMTLYCGERGKEVPTEGALFLKKNLQENITEAKIEN